jgi:hypothetical protein
MAEVIDPAASETAAMTHAIYSVINPLRDDLHARKRAAKEAGRPGEATGWVSLAADISVHLIRLDVAIANANLARQVNDPAL